jgi:radical SAM protein with 4Fe4S-binding SPASM domain
MIRLSKNCFSRDYGPYVVLNNALNKSDRVFDLSGQAFMAEISRIPQQESLIIESLKKRFVGVTHEELKQDFNEFTQELVESGFLVQGDTQDELMQRDPCFSYSLENPHTTVDLAMHTENKNEPSTQDVLGAYFLQHPHIVAFHLDVTSFCNERCQHCYLPNERLLKHIDTKLALNVLDQLVSMKTYSVTLSGGECLLHPDFELILRHARANDFNVSILSNLTTLDDRFVSLFKEMNLALVQVSLYSLKPDEHDSITRVPGSHTKTLAAIEKLFIADVPVQISCPVMKINQHSYQSVMNWAYQHRMKAYTDFIMMARSDKTVSNLDYRLSIAETEFLLRGMVEYDLEYRSLVDTGTPPETPEERAKRPVCGVGIDSLCLNADGNYYPCSGFQGFPLGSAEEVSVREVWETSPAILKLRNLTGADFPKCIHCIARSYCSMCLVRNFNVNDGNMFKVSQLFCDVAFLNKRIVEEKWAKKLQLKGAINRA